MQRIGAGAIVLALTAFPQTTGENPREAALAPRLKNLGKLHFTVTTRSADAQAFIDQGLTLVYGFNHAEALRSFREAARLDPNCAMAYWGQALALAPNINDSAIGPDREQQGHAAISEARKRSAGASAKEQALIAALSERFSAAAGSARDGLNRAYARAMTKTYERFADDPDVATLYADSVMNTMPWDYWRKDGSPKPGVAEIRKALEQAIRRKPEHAGANHMYIHLMEASGEVDAAVPNADRLGGLVPAAGHLVHMPSHIYIREGRYADAVEANIKASAADEDYITQCRAQGMYPAAYYPHNVHFLAVALAMDGRAKEALAAARKVAGHHDHAMLAEPGFGFAHLMKTIPLFTMVRFGRWDEVLKEPEPGNAEVFGRVMWHFARGFAWSATGKPAAAGDELASLNSLAADRSLAELKIFDLNPLSELARIAAAMLTGELALRAGHHDEAINAFRAAVDLDDNLKYSEPPDWMLPPRQYLAAALERAGRLADAEKVYREDLNRHRGNGWSLKGLEIALNKQGRTAQADEVKRQFERAWARADVQLRGSRF